MITRYDGPLYVLPFDHRSSYVHREERAGRIRFRARRHHIMERAMKAAQAMEERFSIPGEMSIKHLKRK